MLNVRSIVSEEILKLILDMKVDKSITSILTNLEEGAFYNTTGLISSTCLCH